MNVLVVSPHLDDETLGAGGTLLRYAGQGAKLYWINFTNSREDYGHPKEIVLQRAEQLEKVKARYGIEKMWDLGLRPTGLRGYRDTDLIDMVIPVIDEIKPEVLLLPYEHDIHSDHAVVFKTMLPFTKSFRYPSIKKVLAMEILSETEFAVPYQRFNPNYFVDITDYIDQKVSIMQHYTGEIGQHPFPRSLDNIKALAHFRGATAGVKYAEAFMLLKCIESGL